MIKWGGKEYFGWRLTQEACAACRTSGIYTSNQESANQYVESAFQKGRDALDQGLQVNDLPLVNQHKSYQGNCQRDQIKVASAAHLKGII
jgi:hypothetical protein